MIELSRTITFGRFIDNHSALARMDPRAKMLCAILLIGLFSYVGTFAALALCLLCCVLVQALSGLPIAYVLRGFKFPLLFVLFLYVFQVLFYVSPTQHTTLIWHWWLLVLSREGLIHNAQICIRVLLLFYLVSMLMFTTSVVDLTDGSEALFSPLQRLRVPVNDLVMVFVIALKFVPILVGEVERLTKAQATRGVRFDKGNPIQRVYQFGSLLVPLFLSGFRRVDALTIAMEARGYRGGYRGWRRTRRREMRFTCADTLAMIGSVLVCGVIVFVNIFSRF
ncbi:MAG: energy-coupling factor transporter transmembrane protein EcfT [Chloroflexota bacterium]|nr:energy-coupling factor transporter transmembrane protein EcfT [Chloroflexota bacterium]